MKPNTAPDVTKQSGPPNSGSVQRVVRGIIIPTRPPPGVVEALRNFVEAIEAYDKTGVWPDNYTLRKLADEGRHALNCGYSSNDQAQRPALGESEQNAT